MPQQPIEFVRGGTFIQKLPLHSFFSPGEFIEWRIQAQLIRSGGSFPFDKIADIPATWMEEGTDKSIVLFHNVTGKWPVGGAELHVRLTSADGQKIHTQIIPYVIRAGFIE